MPLQRVSIYYGWSPKRHSDLGPWWIQIWKGYARIIQTQWLRKACHSFLLLNLRNRNRYSNANKTRFNGGQGRHFRWSFGLQTQDCNLYCGQASLSPHTRWCASIWTSTWLENPVNSRVGANVSVNKPRLQSCLTSNRWVRSGFSVGFVISAWTGHLVSFYTTVGGGVLF